MELDFPEEMDATPVDADVCVDVRCWVKEGKLGSVGKLLLILFCCIKLEILGADVTTPLELTTTMLPPATEVVRVKTESAPTNCIPDWKCLYRAAFILSLVVIARNTTW